MMMMSICFIIYKWIHISCIIVTLLYVVKIYCFLFCFVLKTNSTCYYIEWVHIYWLKNWNSGNFLFVKQPCSGQWTRNKKDFFFFWKMIFNLLLYWTGLILISQVRFRGVSVSLYNPSKDIVARVAFAALSLIKKYERVLGTRMSYY